MYGLMCEHIQNSSNTAWDMGSALHVCAYYNEFTCWILSASPMKNNIMSGGVLLEIKEVGGKGKREEI